MADGREYYLDHPDFAAFSRERNVLIVSPNKVNFLSIANITRVDTTAAVAA